MLKRHSILCGLQIAFDEEGKHVNAVPEFHVGVWDTDTNAWACPPVLDRSLLTTVSPDGKKRLNDALSIATAKVLEDNARLRERLEEALHEVKGKHAGWAEEILIRDDAETQLALSERMLASSRQHADELMALASVHGAKLDKIRRLTFGLLGR